MKSYVYISTGQKKAQYTLRHVFSEHVTAERVVERDWHVKNLGVDFEAAKKEANQFAKEYNLPEVTTEYFKLNPYNYRDEEAIAAQKEQDRLNTEQRIKQMEEEQKQLAQKAELERQRLEKMEYLGTVGEKIEVELKLIAFINVGVNPYNGYTNWLVLFDDEHENRVVYFGSAGFDGLRKGEKAIIKFTVKDHKEYKGEKQTVMLRPKVIKHLV